MAVGYVVSTSKLDRTALPTTILEGLHALNPCTVNGVFCLSWFVIAACCLSWSVSGLLACSVFGHILLNVHVSGGVSTWTVHNKLSNAKEYRRRQKFLSYTCTSEGSTWMLEALFLSGAWWGVLRAELSHNLKCRFTSTLIWIVATLFATIQYMTVDILQFSPGY